MFSRENSSRNLTRELVTPPGQITRETIQSLCSAIVEELRRRHPNFGYLHVIEPRVRGIFDREDGTLEKGSNDFLRGIWTGKAWISAGGFTRESAIKQAHEKGELVAFGRHFTSNVSLITVTSCVLCA